MKKYIIHGFIILCLGISDGMAGVRTGIHAGISRTGLTGDTPEDAS